MRKKRLFVWALTLVCTILSFSCKDDKDDVENVIAQEYFKVDGSKFYDDYLPYGDENLIRNLNTPRTVVKNGTPYVIITSLYKLQKVFIGVQGRKGYYERNIDTSGQEYTDNGILYSYEVQLRISEDINVSSFVISLTVEGLDGILSRAYNSDLVYVSGSGSSENLLGVNYFTIRNGEYVEGNLPSTGSGTLINNIQIPTSVQKGGSSLITFTSTEKLIHILITAGDYKGGYYEQSIKDHSTILINDKREYYYEVHLNISDNIEFNSFNIAMVVETENKYFSTIYTSNSITVTEPIVGNPIRENYFNIIDGTFVRDYQPVGLDDFIYDLSYQDAVIKGANSVVNVISSQLLKSIYIGVEGVDGYYQQSASSPELVQVAGSNMYSYEVILAINNDIKYSNFRVVVTAETADASISKKYTTNYLTVKEPVVGNPIEDYFTVQGGTFVSDDLPATGTEKMINNLSVNEYAINGGASLVSFTSKETFREIYVGVVGERGYYKQIVGEYPVADNGEISYQVLLNINEDINKDSFKAQIAAKTDDGRISSQASTDNISIIEVGTGDLQISLSWDQLDDVDLHVVDPYGNHIYYGDRYSFPNQDEIEFYFYCDLIQKYFGYNTSNLNHQNQNHWSIVLDYMNQVSQSVWDNYWNLFDEYLSNNLFTYHGYLDLDSNPGCSKDGINNENIYFENPIGGTYYVYVDLYSKCGSPAGAIYTVTVRYRGQIIDQQTKQFSHYNQGSGNDSEQYVFIGAYDIEGGSRSVVGASVQNPYLLQIREMLNAK